MSVFREVQRAELAGLVISRRARNTRLVRADTASPYYPGLAEVLTLAFGVPAVLAAALGAVPGVAAGYLLGSWAARHAGRRDVRPAGDIEVLVLGDPDPGAVQDAIGPAGLRLGHPVRVSVREPSWLETGTGSFREVVRSQPMLKLSLAPMVTELSTATGQVAEGSEAAGSPFGEMGSGHHRVLTTAELNVAIYDSRVPPLCRCKPPFLAACSQ